MTSDQTFRYYKIEGDALELLRSYKNELDALVADRTALEAEFAERAQQQGEYHQANLRALWRRMAASVGLDPETTWGSPEFQIETRYLDHGFGALLYMPMSANPLHSLLGGEPATPLADPATDPPPKDTTVH